MIIYPAIDLKDGDAVRLFKGQMEKATVFNTHPYAQAISFQNMGAKWLHLVDLNGAFEGTPINGAAVNDILKHIQIPCQLGGGIRDMKTIEYWLNQGVTRVILGTITVENPQLVREAAASFPNQIAIGLDAYDGKVATRGWATKTDIPVIELAQEFEDAGVCAVIYTDIDKDGAMGGPNITATKALAKAISIPVIASGGVSSMHDLHALHTDGMIAGAITGRALYDGAIDLSEAIAAFA